MKKAILLFFIACFTAMGASALASGVHSLPDCTEKTPDTVSCYASRSETHEEVPNMLINNKAVQKLNQFSKHYSRGFNFGEVAMTKFGVTKDAKGLYVYHTRYEIFLDDSRGVDISGSRFIWTVDETYKTDGYNGFYSYQNAMAKVGKIPQGVVFGNGDPDDEIAIIESVRAYLEAPVTF